MYQTQFGPFNGKSWEVLCQQVFKMKYANDGYQPMPASPGDYGIEGYTAHTGVAFQCYCPEKQCTSGDLYKNQRDKITADLRKLEKNVSELERRLGTTKIREWNFVSPVVDKNDLLAHAKSKEDEVRGWGLSILASDFKILLRDGEFYIQEIKQIQSLNGQPLHFDKIPPELEELSGDATEYDKNIGRKSRLRVGSATNYQDRSRRLAESTRDSFLQASPYLKGIENAAPTVYFQLLRIVKEFEFHVRDACMTWDGSPEQLTAKLSGELESRITLDLANKIDGATVSRVTRHMIARWLAVCQLDFD